MALGAVVALALVAVFFVVRSQNRSPNATPKNDAPVVRQPQDPPRPRPQAPPTPAKAPDTRTPSVVVAPPKPANVPVKPAAPQKLAVRLESKPSGAQILVGPENKKLGSTPHLFEVLPGKTRKMALVLALEGYQREQVDLQFDRSKDVVIVLKKVVVAPIAQVKKKKRPRVGKKTAKVRKPKTPRFSTNDLK